MSSRTGNWMIGFGSLVALVGICLMPAGLGAHGDRSLLGLGSALFGTGALTMAAGIYLKALAVGTKVLENAPSHAPASKAAPRGACDLCRRETPVIHCKVHQFHLCAGCLAAHYDFRACVYVPSTRRTETKGRSMTAKGHV